jgi:hypothetical protein
MEDNDIFFPPTPVEYKYYAYYAESGEIIGLSTQDIDGLTSRLEISERLYNKFSSREEHPHNWIVNLVETQDKESKLELIPKKYKGYSFKSNMFELIINEVTDDTELIVTWSAETKHWKISFSDVGKRIMLAKRISVKNLVFFVVLENDFDFLIRTIILSVDSLLKEDQYFPFESKLENQIDNISIVSRKVFETYGLIKIYG